MPNINILFVNHTGVVSGAERVLLMILENLDRKRFSAAVSCPPDSDLAGMVRERNVRVVTLPELKARFTWNPFHLLRYFRSYAQAIRTFRKSPDLRQADLIHANSVRAGLLASLAGVGFGIPTVWHIHDIMKVHPFSTGIRAISLLLPNLSVVAVSRAAAKRFRGLLLRPWVTRVPVDVIYNPVDVSRFDSDAAARARTRLALGLNKRQFVFAIIGQLTVRKGQLDAIKAFKDVRQSCPEAKLLIVGGPMFAHDHEYLERLRASVIELGLESAVDFLGYRTDIEDLLEAVDCVVIKSRREPFALIALEALAAEKPVVAASVEGIPELMRDGVTGILVPPHDQGAFSAAMIRVCKDPLLCEQLAKNGRARVENDFTIPAFMRRFESVCALRAEPNILAATRPVQV
jgi:L-malate glycosyltransferase